MCVPLPPWLTLYRWPRAWGCAIRREESQWNSHSKEESSHKWDPTPKRIAILLWVGSLQISASPLGVPCPPKAKGVWTPMVLSRNFWKLPGPSRTILGHSGTFRDGFGMFRTTSRTFWGCFGMFRSYLDRFRAHLSYS